MPIPFYGILLGVGAYVLVRLSGVTNYLDSGLVKVIGGTGTFVIFSTSVLLQLAISRLNKKNT